MSKKRVLIVSIIISSLLFLSLSCSDIFSTLNKLGVALDNSGVNVFGYNGVDKQVESTIDALFDNEDSVFGKKNKDGKTKIELISGTVNSLMDNDNFNEPIADATRGILDGHIVLSRALAHKNHYPAIDVSSSISRLMNEICDDEHKQLAAKVRDTLAVYKDAEDLISIGAYEFGTNEKIDTAINYIDKVTNFLKQSTNESFSVDETLYLLKTIFNS